MKGTPPYDGASVDFVSGRIVGIVTVAGNHLLTARALAVKEARALETRITGVLAGRVTGPAPILPAKAKAAPPPHGPNLEGFALMPTDFTIARVRSQGYTTDQDLNPISEYQRTMAPAGAFSSLQEQVALFRGPVQAAFEMAALRAALTTAAGLKKGGFNGPGEPFYNPRVISVTGGAGSFATSGAFRSASGKNFTLGYVVVRVASTLEIDIVAGPAGVLLPDSAFQALVTATADRAAKGLDQPHPAAA